MSDNFFCLLQDFCVWQPHHHPLVETNFHRLAEKLHQIYYMMNGRNGKNTRAIIVHHGKGSYCVEL